MDSTEALRRNLASLLDAARDGLRRGPTGVLQLEAQTDIGKSTLYRILDPRAKNPAQLDTLERIAAAFGLQVWQLLVPRMDPLDPPAVIGERQMSVLRSVFAQTRATGVANVEQPESPKRHQEQADGRPAHRPTAPKRRRGTSPNER